MNWTYTDCNSSREIPRYICIFFVKLKKNFFFPFLKNFFYFLLKLPTTPPLLLNFHFHIFLWFFQLEKKKFLFFSFSVSSLLYFLFSFSCFLSNFLLKSSNTPLLFLNFHFRFTITLQKKSSIFKLNFIYISKFWGFVIVFKYFISKSLTSMLNF